VASKRTIRLKAQTRATSDQAYENFAEGMAQVFGTDPREDHETGPELRTAFRSVYGVLEWCQTIRRSPHAGFFLFELRCALPIAVGLAGTGLYETANVQLRYALECAISYIYFSDHRRELELAMTDQDQWDQTRPSAVLKFLRKLPEFRNSIGGDLLNGISTLYSELCRFVHARRPAYMGQRRFLSQIKVDVAQARSFTRRVQTFSQTISGVFWLGFNDYYTKSGEVKKAILRSSISAPVCRRIETLLRQDG
jgi:hypothetical protein